MAARSSDTGEGLTEAQKKKSPAEGAKWQGRGQSSGSEPGPVDSDSGGAPRIDVRIKDDILMKCMPCSDGHCYKKRTPT